MNPRTPTGPSAALYRTNGIGTELVILVTDSSVLVSAGLLLDRAIRRLDEVASRFRADSELSALNRASGSRVAVSRHLYELVESAVWAAGATDGAVDPTVGEALIAMGYDRDFSIVSAGVDGGGHACPAVGWSQVELDPEARTVRVPHGTVIDLGATAKAFAADRIATDAATSLGCGVLVSLGGDIAVAGTPPPGGFPVGVDDGGGACDETVAIRSGGLATSGISARRWRLGNDMAHHIVDPRTGASAATPWRAVTVAAATCLEANAAATAAVVKGLGAIHWLGDHGLPARLVGRDGRIRRIGEWPDEDHSPLAGALTS